MADIAITVDDVRAVGTTIKLTAGATLTPGDYAYADASDAERLKPASRDISLVVAAALHFVVSDADTGEDVYVVNIGDVSPGFTVVIGEIYIVGTGSGGIEAVSAATIASGEFVNILGVGKTNDKMQLIFATADAAKV